MIPFADVPGCELVAPGVERQRLLSMMALFLEGVGAVAIFARLPGYDPPEHLEGVKASFRPDLRALLGPPEAHRLLWLDVLTLADVEAPDCPDRLTLLASSASLYGGILTYAVPEGRAYRRLRTLLLTLGLDVPPARIWAL